MDYVDRHQFFNVQKVVFIYYIYTMNFIRAHADIGHLSLYLKKQFIAKTYFNIFLKHNF